MDCHYGVQQYEWWWVITLRSPHYYVGNVAFVCEQSVFFTDEPSINSVERLIQRSPMHDVERYKSSMKNVPSAIWAKRGEKARARISN
jgi:hypothetical protein